MHANIPSTCAARATELVEEFTRRWKLEFAIPAREVIRGTYALSRGTGLERLLDPQATPLAQFEEMFLAYAMGVIRPRTSTGAHSSNAGQADRLRALVGEQLARDRWSRDHLLAYQQDRLQALLSHAVTASPYYREVLGPDAASGPGAAGRAAHAAQGHLDGQLRPRGHRPAAAPRRPGGPPGRPRPCPAPLGPLPGVRHRGHHGRAWAVRLRHR
jgi:hypothetical protein